MDLAGMAAAAGALAAASAFGLWRKRSEGRVRDKSASAGRLSAADLGIDLDPRATLVQFSSKVCRYCGPTRRVLTELADQHLDLARRLTVLRTPTVLLLDGTGRITHRVSGPPRRAELAAAVGALVGAG
jgi:thioredoxin-related protein